MLLFFAPFSTIAIFPLITCCDIAPVGSAVLQSPLLTGCSLEVNNGSCRLAHDNITTESGSSDSQKVHPVYTHKPVGYEWHLCVQNALHSLCAA